jgi:hypothetical protein
VQQGLVEAVAGTNPLGNAIRASFRHKAKRPISVEIGRFS